MYVTSDKIKLFDYIYKKSYDMLLNHVKFTMDRGNAEEIVSDVFFNMMLYKSADGLRKYVYEDSGKINHGLLKRYAYQIYSTRKKSDYMVDVDDLNGWEETRDYFNKIDIELPDSLSKDALLLAEFLSCGYDIIDFNHMNKDKLVKELRSVLKSEKSNPPKKVGRKLGFNLGLAIRLRRSGLSYAKIGKLVGASRESIFQKLKRLNK